MLLKCALTAGLFLFAPACFAQDFGPDKADSVWVAICSVLVLLMTPALAHHSSG